MVMPVYGGNTGDDERRGGNQAWTKQESASSLVFAVGLHTPAASDLAG